MRAGLPALATIALASCAPAKGVGVAPLRPGIPMVSYEQTRAAQGGLFRIAVIAPDGKDARVGAGLEKAFGAAALKQARGEAVDAAAAALRDDGFDDFHCGVAGADYFAGDAGGKAWSAEIPGPGGKVLASLELRDEALAVSEGPRGGLASASFVGGDAAGADRNASTVLAAGLESGLAQVKEQHLEGVLVAASDSGGIEKLLVTSGLKGRIDLSAWSGPVEFLLERTALP